MPIGLVGEVTPPTPTPPPPPPTGEGGRVENALIGAGAKQRVGGWVYMYVHTSIIRTYVHVLHVRNHMHTP